ncbi:MAG: Holliday junction resolvase RuvX [Bacteroidales bacterium]|nr:Holliday junction resolvase RuvX [Bacteroidales bacterium]
MGRFIAIDYGLKRVGIAVSDPLNMFGQPFVTIKPEELFSFLSEYMKKENVSTIILGYAKNCNNTPAQFQRHIEKVYNKLKQTFPTKEIVYYDERFTSKLALKSMIEAGSKKMQRRKKENIDKISAAIILNDYLFYIKQNKK